MRHRAGIIILLVICIGTAFRCSSLQPEFGTGMLAVQIEQQEPDGAVTPKSADTLSRLHCLLYRGETTVHNGYYTRQGDYFQVIIKGLIPSDNYRIVLWGFDENGTLTVQGKAADISIRPDDITYVRLSWVEFRLEMTSPKNMQVISDNLPVFDWNTIDNALQYEIQIDTTITYSSRQCITARTEQSYFQLPEPLSDNTYYWRLRCQDRDTCWSDFTGSFSVIVKTAGPPPPVLIHPADGATMSPNQDIRFDLSDTGGADTYRWEISREETFATLYRVNAGLAESETYWPYYHYIDIGEYYWRVASIDSNGISGEWSEIFGLLISTN